MLIGAPLLDVFDRMAIGGLVLSKSGHVLAINPSARRTLEAHFDIHDPGERLLDGTGREFVKYLLRRCRDRVHLDCGDWIIVDRENKRPLILNSVSVPAPGEDGPQTVLMLLDLDTAPHASGLALERIFKLSPAEARLAILLAGGATVTEAANLQGVRVATTRAQLKAVFEKTGTHRQAELLMLISRLSALPSTDTVSDRRVRARKVVQPATHASSS